jgi:hypothetical protein
MEKVFETSYGDVKIISRYDCSNGSYYDAYDAETDNYLGELWNMPYWDDDDEDDSYGEFHVAIETAIENEDIKNPFDKIDPVPNIPKQVYISNVLEFTCGVCTAVATPYDSREKCIENKLNAVNTFIASLDGKEYEVNDADVICEVVTKDKSRYLCVTYKLADVR